MPPTPKPLERRQRRNTTGLGLVEAQPQAVPDPPKGLLPATKQVWTALFTSELAAVIKTDTDLPALNRLFTLYDERERCYREFKKERLVKGSMGQPVVNPLAKQIASLDSEIRNLEDRFGLTPMARLRLGVQFGEAHKSLEEVNRRLDAADETDPRLATIEGGAGLQVDRG